MSYSSILESDVHVANIEIIGSIILIFSGLCSWGMSTILIYLVRQLGREI